MGYHWKDSWAAAGLAPRLARATAIAKTTEQTDRDAVLGIRDGKGVEMERPAYWVVVRRILAPVTLDECEKRGLMRILVVGSGGREHAIIWSLSRSSGEHQLYCAPGNPGTGPLATNVPIAADKVPSLVAFAISEGIELCIVGPEVPLVMGLADRLRDAGILVVGPSAAAARLEGSKAFSKAFMRRYGIPTAEYRIFQGSEHADALSYVHKVGAPIVIKASGLAAGKGAVVCMTMAEAEEALSAMMEDQMFGDAASQVVVEEFMEGEEVSLFALCDGSDYVLLSPAQDHKRIGEGDTGPNTGGMGAYCPAPVLSEPLLESACANVIEPTLAGMAREGHPYSGILYVGLMLTPHGPRVVEYNCRLGDPETQPVLMLLESDAVELFTAAAAGQLKMFDVQVSSDSAACVVLASEGYPGSYPKGRRISGVEAASTQPGVEVFQAGTSMTPDGLATSGGRVMAVTARAPELEEALAMCYEAVGLISFEGMQYRRDIGKKGLAHLAKA
ncbi:MAG: phosphoribosylamine--glycine ligase [Rhodothermales bacterium]|jgi:phosphoribosylamine--glycine ligase